MEAPPTVRLHCCQYFLDVLIEAFPSIASALKPSGYLVLSGILKDHANECLAAARDAGLHAERVVTTGKWVTALASRRSP